MTTIPISFGRLRRLFIVLGIPPRSSWVEIDEQELRVRMSYAFRSNVPRSSIRSVKPWAKAKPLSIGVHGWRGRWIVNGTNEDLVVIDIEPAARGYVLGLPVSLTQLSLSVDDNAALKLALAVD